jgi:glutamyl-Q tRNA(Asp) synthetase
VSYRTRFAPSPTGPLHLGHAFSALVASRRAAQAGGEMLLRIEDLDRGRARAAWEEAIHADLAWLGIAYPRPVMRQSERGAAYDAALGALWARGLIYPCTCKRRDIAAAASAPQEGAPVTGPDGIVYPGTCRRTPEGAMPADGALRLNMQKALQQAGGIAFLETGSSPAGETGRIRVAPEALIAGVGDVALRRPGMAAAYHLAVVVDDAAQGVTEVVRGQDLFEATPIHVVLQRLLGLPTPRYHHHRLIRDDAGRRLAKRDDARALATYRAAGRTPADICRMLGLAPEAA